MKEKTCLVIVGPTAVGKTGLAIDLAQNLNTSIVSADSRQCYKELNIGVAKPSDSQLNTTPHYFINSHSIQEEVNAKIFESYALNISNQLFEKNGIILLVGGTGLYVKSFLEGLDAMPEVDPEIIQKISQQYQSKGLEWLQAELKKVDTLFFNNGEISNPHRALRALSFKVSTGKSILEFRSGLKKDRPFNILKIGLELPRDLLITNINQRIEEMISDGLINEVESLLPYKQLTALQTVGYKELFDFFENKISKQQAIEKIRVNTRQYAKRQMTWFKKETDINWIEMTSPKELIYQKIQALLSKFKT